MPATCSATARNALLQILNTVLKHVTLYPLVRHLPRVGGFLLSRACAHASCCNCSTNPLTAPTAAHLDLARCSHHTLQA